MNSYHSPLFIKNHRWYRCLVPHSHIKATSLQEHFPASTLGRYLVVCYTPPEVYRAKRLFAVFPSYLEFYHYSQLFPEPERNFYEVITGELPQKPHFDIDLSLDGDTVTEAASLSLCRAVMEACVEVLDEYGIKLDPQRDILLYTSHGELKLSYHIVLHHWCHHNHRQANAFYSLVTQRLSHPLLERYPRALDPSVYSAIQQWRIIGCQKSGSNRPKIFVSRFQFKEEWITHQYDDQEIADSSRLDVMQLQESLCSEVSCSTILPTFKSEEPRLLSLEPHLSTSSVAEALNYLVGQPFRLRRVQGEQILLDRLAPTLCPTCSVVHDHDHPYLYIRDNKIYWNCRRSRQSFLLGAVQTTKAEQTTQTKGVQPLPRITRPRSQKEDLVQHIELYGCKGIISL